MHFFTPIQGHFLFYCLDSYGFHILFCFCVSGYG